MKKLFLYIISFLCSTTAYPKIQVVSDSAFCDSVRKSEHPYKLIYILSEYCPSSVARFPKLLQLLDDKPDMAFFPVCAQDVSELEVYLKDSDVCSNVYFINQDRKKRWIDFYNPIKYACDYLQKYFGVDTEKMGASDYFVLDCNNNIILQTDYEMSDSIYFGLLSPRDNTPQPVDIGDDMVDADLIDPYGNIRHLSEFKGRYILLDFWNRGCGPCMMAFPELAELSQEYKENLEVVGICIGNKKSMDAVLAEYKPEGHQWRQRKLGAEGLVSAYQVMSVPYYVLISPEGKILDMWTGYRKGSLKAKMQELMK